MNVPGTSIGVGDVYEVATGPAGVVYFAGATQLYRRTADGLVSKVRVAVPDQSELPSIDTIAVAASGDLYVSSYQKIYKMSGGTGTPQLLAGGGLNPADGPALNVRLNAVQALKVAPDGLYFIDRPMVRRLTASGMIETVVTGTDSIPPPGFTGVASPGDLAVDGSGNLYIKDNARIFRRTPAGVLTAIAGGGTDSTSEGIPATGAQLSFSSIASDGAGNLYIGEGYRIRVIDAQTGIIRTVGGNQNEGGLQGDGGPARSARFGGHLYLDVDAGGNIYIADLWNLRLRRIAAGTGIVTTIAGGGPSGDGGPATAAQVYSPKGLALDSAGNLYIADSNNARIRRVAASTRTISTFLGDGAPFQYMDNPATKRFRRPTGLAFDSSGKLYIRDVYGIRKADAGNLSVIAGGGTFIGAVPSSIAATEMNITSGHSVAVAPNGDVYFDSYGKDDVFRVQGGHIWNVSRETFSIPSIAFDATGSLLIGTHSSKLYRMNTTTEALTLLSGSGFGRGENVPLSQALLFNPRTVAADRAGNIYFAEYIANPAMRIRKIDAATLTVSTIAGGGSVDEPADGSPALQAKIYDIGAMVADKNGNVYVSDWFNDRVWRLSPAFTIATGGELPRAQAGAAYSITLAVSGGSPPYKSWALIAGQTPAGLTSTGRPAKFAAYHQH